MQSALESCHKDLKCSQQQGRRLGRKVESLTSVIAELKDKGMVSENCGQVLDATLPGVPNSVITRQLRFHSTNREEYDPILKSFAQTLHFYSAKVYEYVHRTFELAFNTMFAHNKKVLQCN